MCRVVLLIECPPHYFLGLVEGYRKSPWVLDKGFNLSYHNKETY